MIVYLVYLKMNIIEEKHKTICEAFITTNS